MGEAIKIRLLTNQSVCDRRSAPKRSWSRKRYPLDSIGKCFWAILHYIGLAIFAPTVAALDPYIPWRSTPRKVSLRWASSHDSVLPKMMGIGMLSRGVGQRHMPSLQERRSSSICIINAKLLNGVSLYSLREQLKVQFRATQKAQCDWEVSGALKPRNPCFRIFGGFNVVLVQSGLFSMASGDGIRAMPGWNETARVRNFSYNNILGIYIGVMFVFLEKVRPGGVRTFAPFSLRVAPVALGKRGRTTGRSGPFLMWRCLSTSGTAHCGQ
ncbi:hypothetical protein JB92DRAFT_3098203 [Gautieria morchelliformis]|nr:hypothetical protein JB92DRAFT_3098203 [Gautieria morchelliformis]